MKIQADYELCEANAVCVELCDEVFRVEEDDTLTLLTDIVPEHLLAHVKRAVERCPRQALSLSD